jgi:hypothetical protein
MYKKKCQVAAAKEVGMGNPAEKNDRSPDMCIVGDHLFLARNFSKKFADAERELLCFPTLPLATGHPSL